MVVYSNSKGRVEYRTGRVNAFCAYRGGVFQYFERLQDAKDFVNK